jgi:hypothetical protein
MLNNVRPNTTHLKQKLDTPVNAILLAFFQQQQQQQPIG